MNVRRWLWCFFCQRCFEAHLSREPDALGSDSPDEWEPPHAFAAELEMQLGVEQQGRVVVKCSYDDCAGGINGFWWWERFRVDQPDLPASPEVGKAFPLYEKMG
jgi:hypothetical protein